jgi:hypothetical protein
LDARRPRKAFQGEVQERFARITLAGFALLRVWVLGHAARTRAWERKWEHRIEELHAFAEPERARQ